MDAIVGTVFEVIQFGSLILAILTLVFSIKRGIANKNILLDVPMILLMLHGIVYYFWLFSTRYGFIPRFEGTPFTYWSFTRRFHGYATLFIIVITSYLRQRGRLHGK